MDNENDTSPSPADHFPRTPRHVVSLGAELSELRHAVEAARMIVDILRHQAADDEYDLFHAPDAASAVLALIECRLLLVCRVVAGHSNVELLLAHHNQRAPTAQDDEPDIVLGG
ncbi:MAG: hypothetical protein ACREUF_12205 [Solimonas sp.]